MNLKEIFGGIATKGADYLIEREKRRSGSEVPFHETPAEKAIKEPAPEPIVQGGKVVGTQSAPMPAWVKPLALGVGVSVLAGLLLPVVKHALKGGK